jgi:hypothetical protein
LILAAKTNKLQESQTLPSNKGNPLFPPYLFNSFKQAGFLHLFIFFTSFLELIIFISYFIVRFLRPKFLIFCNHFCNHFCNESKPPQLIVQILISKFLNSGSDLGSDFGSKSIPLQLIVQILISKFLNSGNDSGNDFGNETFYKKDKISSWKAKMEWTTLRLKSNGLIAYLHNP